MELHKQMKCDCFNSRLKVRYPKRAASRYIRNMARKDTLATPCIFLRERLFGRENKGCWVQNMLCVEI